MEFMKAGTHNWGGKRENSGRKKKPPSSYLFIRIPIEQKNLLISKYGKEINNLIREFLKNLL